MSDLHAEFMSDAQQAGFVASVPRDSIGALVLAGDIGVAARGTLLAFLRKLLHRIEAPVVYVPGNHEFYSGAEGQSYGGGERARRKGQERVRAVLARLRSEFGHFHGSVDPECYTLGGVHFVAATMWFGSPATDAPYSQLNDYRLIRGFAEWERDESARHLAFIQRNTTRESVVVTHHLPSQGCVAPEYRNERTNAFYVHPDAHAVIRENKPMAWIHGHSHVPLRARSDETLLLRNPYGYAPDKLVLGFSRYATLDTSDANMRHPHEDLASQPPAEPAWIGSQSDGGIS